MDHCFSTPFYGYINFWPEAICRGRQRVNPKHIHLAVHIQLQYPHSTPSLRCLPRQGVDEFKYFSHISKIYEKYQSYPFKWVVLRVSDVLLFCLPVQKNETSYQLSPKKILPSMVKWEWWTQIVSKEKCIILFGKTKEESVSQKIG